MTDLRTRSIEIGKMRSTGTLASVVANMPRNDPRFSLFLGAGASLSSGVPTSQQLIRTWQRRLFLDLRKYDSWRPHLQVDFDSWKVNEFPAWKDVWQANYGRQPSDYSLLFSRAYPDIGDRQGFIQQVVTGCEPGMGYIYLAALALAGHFHTFLTTNFDDLIHDALFRYAGLKPMVCAFDSQVSNASGFRLQNPCPKIIKLHGDFLFTNLRNVGSELARLEVNMEDKFQRTCENYGLIVIGYGGLDQSIMDALRVILHRRDCLNHGLHWCVFNDPRTPVRKNDSGEPTLSIPEDLYRMWETHSDKVHLYVVDTFDEVMQTFYDECRCEPPPELARPEEKALYMRLRDGIENADQTWRLRPKFATLLKSFRDATENRRPETLSLLDSADEYHRDGNACIRLKQFPSARRKHEAAVVKATEAIEKATNTLHLVRAYRRRSGSRVSIAEVIAKHAGVSKASALGQRAKRDFQDFATHAREDVRTGMHVDQTLGSPAEVRGQRFNLCFNGMLSCAYLIDSGVKLNAKELDEAQGWMDLIAEHEMYGDEYLDEIATEFGGLQLIKALLERAGKS